MKEAHGSLITFDSSGRIDHMVFIREYFNMRYLLVVCIFGLITSPAMAEKEPVAGDHSDHSRVDCGLLSTCFDWDGTFDPAVCGGAPVWGYGPDNMSPASNCAGDPAGDVLGTALNANYPNLSGERAVVGTFEVTDNCRLMEMCHFYDIESYYDGGNVEVNGVVVEPMGGYPEAAIYSGAGCVGDQPGFSGSSGGAYVTDCFDLSEYTGQIVEVAVKFGSDSSVQYPGWCIDSITVGGIDPVPVEEATWGQIKADYR